MDTPLTHTQLLTHKHAVIFGAGGAVGTAVAKEFAAQGATVFSTLVPSQFITARAAARHMVQQHSGVILFVTAGLNMTKTPNVTAIGAAFGAMESLLRCLAADLGPAGVRVVGIRSGPMVETRTIQQGIERVVNTMGVSKAQVVSQFEQATLLKRLSTAADTARVAAFLASDGARTITGTLVNASSGRIID